ncbi:MAG: glycerophosphodiester phosphodiesterase family protein [Planctomycetota bacterium]|jgi:glycerophosphoryl diester phosphodiesterase
MRAAIARVRTDIRRLVTFDLLLKAASFVILAPLFELIAHALLSRSGSASVTNADIPSFALSPAGAALVLFLGATAVAAILAEQAGLMLILSDPAARPRDALRATLTALPRLLTVAVAQLAWLALTLAPLLVGAGLVYAHYLSEHDINWYLATKPTEWRTALLIVGGLAVPTSFVLAVHVVRWAFVVPACLFEEKRGFAALRRSRALLRGRTASVAKPLLGWIGVVSLGSLLLFGVLNVGVELLLAPFTAPTTLIGLTVVLLGSIAVLSFVVSVFAASGYAALTLRLYGKQTAPPQAAPPRRIGWAVLGLALLLSIVVGVFMLQRVEQRMARSREVQATAHRGSSLVAPENSLAAVRQAIDDGADYCEIDVQEMKDGTIVMVHDTDFKRVTGRALRVGETDYDQIKDLDSGSWFDPRFKDERIAKLEQVVDLVAGRMRLNIELKYHGKERRFEERVIAILRRKEFTNQCVITSLEAKGLQAVRRLAPEIEVGQIVTLALGRVEGLKVDFLSMNAQKASAIQIRANRNRGLDTHVWTVNDRQQMHRMIERGAANIITDDPKLLRAVIEERASMSDAELLLLALGRKLRD